MWEIPVQLVKYFYYNICVCVFWVWFCKHTCVSANNVKIIISRKLKKNLEFSIFAIIRLSVKSKYYKLTKTLQRRNCLAEFLFREWRFVIIGKGRHIEYISQRNIWNRNKSCSIFIWVEVSFCYFNDNSLIIPWTKRAQNWITCFAFWEWHIQFLTFSTEGFPALILEIYLPRKLCML